MHRWYRIYYQADRLHQSPLEARSHMWATPAEATKWLGQIRSGQPFAVNEGWWLWDLAANRWV